MMWAARPVILLALALGAAACAPVELWYRPGVTQTRADRDLTDCEVAALAKVPVSTQIRRSPSYYLPPRRVCDTKGNCVLRPGRFVRGNVYSYDANAGLRQRVVAQCMADRGYRPVAVRRCEAGEVPARLRGDAVLPVPGPEACAVRTRGGWVLVGP